MCYAIPGKVKEIHERAVIVDYFGETKRAINEFYDLRVGDYICAQGGYVIKKVPPEEAQDILASWNELFFELRDVDVRLSAFSAPTDIDQKLKRILDKALEGRTLERDEARYLFTLKDPGERALLFKAANFLRQKHHKNSCCVHGIIEISNHCRRACTYCGIASTNIRLARYRMEPERIIQTAVDAVTRYGFQALILQSGEGAGYGIEELTRVIRVIREKAPVLIGISFGEIGFEGLEKLYHAGARALLLRFETSNPSLYEKLHPGMSLRSRIEHLKEAYRLGYMLMTGSLVGLPGATVDDLLNDIYLAKALGAEMYSFGPFLPHPATPLAADMPPATEDVLTALSVTRLIDSENAKILVTTAFETLDAGSRTKGLNSGANSLMLTATPLEYRQHYAIYPNKAYSQIPLATQIEETVALLKSLGRAPTDVGTIPTNDR